MPKPSSDQYGSNKLHCVTQPGLNPLHQLMSQPRGFRRSPSQNNTSSIHFLVHFFYIILPSYSLTFPLPSLSYAPSSIIKVYPVMLEGKAIVGETDMLQTMQKDALHLAAKALDIFEATELIDIARFIKKDFDRAYGWQCVVGTDFSSFVTHCHGCFIHFCVGSLAILLFRGAVNQAHEANLFPTFEALNA